MIDENHEQFGFAIKLFKDKYEEKITKVDNKGKFEVVSFISKNIIPIIAILGVLIYWYLQIK
jgi:hypothetical protein